MQQVVRGPVFLVKAGAASPHQCLILAKSPNPDAISPTGQSMHRLSSEVHQSSQPVRNHILTPNRTVVTLQAKVCDAQDAPVLNIWSTPASAFDLERNFATLAEHWTGETAHLSSTRQIVLFHSLFDSPPSI